MLAKVNLVIVSLMKFLAHSGVTFLPTLLTEMRAESTKDLNYSHLALNLFPLQQSDEWKTWLDLYGMLEVIKHMFSGAWLSLRNLSIIILASSEGC